ncbi:MAG TPA: DUF2341 domain-containing protein [Nanoarchaeota archaeon]|nr:DUF2341 domain-containing protein [Nanoarchaeota archaeon]
MRVDISNIIQELGTQYIEIRDENNNPVKFCYEQANGECNTNPTNIIWVKVPSIPANGETFLIVVPSSTNQASEGDQVFDFYDDFNGNSLDTNKWLGASSDISISNSIITLNTDHQSPGPYLRSIKTWTSGNYIIEVKVVSHTDYVRFLIGFENNVYVYDDGGSNYWGLRVNGQRINSWGYDVPANGLVGIVSLTIVSKTILNDPSNNTPKEWSSYSTNLGRIQLNSWANSDISIDYVAIRKYADQEPTYRIE